MINPAISVVMSVYDDADYVSGSIDSVLGQTVGDFEFIIVNDGSPDPLVGMILADYASRDSRIRLITKSNEGLTRALIDGCAAAKGKYVARIDVGDVMLPERMAQQRTILDKHSDVVLATCWTECCGPEWEHLYTTKEIGGVSVEMDVWVTDVVPTADTGDLLEGPSHHGSVMIRADAYRAVGGYREAFCYGQDWDLWYRLAERGKFAGVQEVLYRCRIFPEGISMQNAERQRQIHAYSRRAFMARRKGEDETPFLEEAAAVRPRHDEGRGSSSVLKRQRLAAGHYFIGEALRRNKDRRCRAYLLMAIRLQPVSLKYRVRLMQHRIAVYKEREP